MQIIDKWKLRVAQPSKLRSGRYQDSQRGRCKRAMTRRSDRGFTLAQMLVVLSILAIMAALIIGTFARARATAQRAQCDARLKAIVLAWDAFRQEQGRAPLNLAELRDKSYIPPDLMRCPADPRADGAENDEDFMIVRAPRDDSELPVIVCPFHEDTGNMGAQGFVGHYTSQFKTAPAVLESGNDVTVQRPQDTAPVAATAGMQLHGGDRIRTGSLGVAKIRFADGSTANSLATNAASADASTATLQGNSDLTVLQCFLDGQTSGPWYTVVRERVGNIFYQVHHGSKFDVVTPTSTAGARGTAFNIVVSANGAADKLTVTEGRVWVSNRQSIIRGALDPVSPGVTITLIGIQLPLTLPGL